MKPTPRRLTLLAGVCAAALAVGACDDQQDAADKQAQPGSQVATEPNTTTESAPETTPAPAERKADEQRGTQTGPGDTGTPSNERNGAEPRSTDRADRTAPAPDRTTPGDTTSRDRAEAAPNTPQTERKPDPVAGTVLATARLKAKNGKEMGTIELIEEADRGVVVRFETTGIPPGEHAIHFHEKGLCEGPDFKSAGEHWRPANWQADADKQIDPGHLGTIVADEQGHVETSLVNAYATLNKDAPNTLFDEDGVSIVIHKKPDSNAAEPGGEAGGRIACAVVTPKQEIEEE